MKREYEEDGQINEQRTPFDDRLEDYLYATYCIEDDGYLWKLIDDLKECYYRQGKLYMKYIMKDKTKL